LPKSSGTKRISESTAWLPNRFVSIYFMFPLSLHPIQTGGRHCFTGRHWAWWNASFDFIRLALWTQTADRMNVSARSEAKVKLIKPDRAENQVSGWDNVATPSALYLKRGEGYEKWKKKTYLSTKIFHSSCLYVLELPWQPVLIYCIIRVVLNEVAWVSGLYLGHYRVRLSFGTSWCDCWGFSLFSSVPPTEYVKKINKVIPVTGCGGL
jgi:hypothetical protein